MIAKLSAFKSSYWVELRKHLDHTAVTNLSAARSLGERAMALGLDTLEIAKIHEFGVSESVSVVEGASERLAKSRRGALFFAEVIVPIEDTHRGARESKNHLKVMIATLTRRTKDLAASNEELKAEILQRKEVEQSLRTSEQTTSQLLQHSREMQEELRLLSRRLLSVQEEERKRISRELHDVIAQALTGINLRLATLKTQAATNTKDFHRKIATTQRIVEKSVNIVHRFARDLRPAVLDDLGLMPALQSHLKGVMEATGMRITLKAFVGIEALDGVMRTVLYRVVQEAISNVVQHAASPRVAITITKGEGGVTMKIQDYGKGFLVDDIRFSKNCTRLGLLGMRERVQMVGGTFAVESTPGKGTTVLVAIPIGRSAAPKRRSKFAKMNPPEIS